MNEWCEKGGSRGYVVTNTILWELGKKGSGFFIRIEPGFEFESSVPWIARWILSQDDKHFLLSAAIHDFLLENEYRIPLADSQWIDAARSQNAPIVKMHMAYVGMVARRFGQYLFNRP